MTHCLIGIDSYSSYLLAFWVIVVYIMRAAYDTGWGKMFKTIKSKFIFVTIFFIILSVGIPTFFLLTQFKNNFHQRSEAMLKATLDVVNNGIINEMSMLGENKNIQNIIDYIAELNSISHIRIITKDGTVKYSTIADEQGKSLEELHSHHLNDVHSGETIISLINKNKVYSAIQPIKNGKRCQTCHKQGEIIAYLDVDIHLTPAERAFYTGSVHIIFLSILMIIVLFSGFYIMFNYFINKPLTRFLAALDIVDSGNLNVRLPAKKDDEIGIIEGHFNSMVQHLKESREKIDEMHFEQLQRADKMVTLGELAAEMAHEINNPAGIIMSRTDYLLLEAGDNRFLRNYIEDYEVIQKQIEKVSAITGNILKYSKKIPKKSQHINLGALVDNVLHILQPRLSKHRINIKREYACEATCDKPRIIGDSQQIEQVLINLINNAIDAIRDNGEIRISVRCLEKGDIELSITDNGVGIPGEIRQQIFSPFFTTKPPERGTGLGLYIVKKICDGHNAHITCFSEKDKGTTFIITFMGKRDRK